MPTRNAVFVGLVAAALLTGCDGRYTPQEAIDEPQPTWYSFGFEKRALPADLVFSEVDSVGLVLEDRSFPLREGSDRVAVLMFSGELRNEGGLRIDEYCLLEDALIKDMAGGQTEVGMPAGTCFKNSWDAPTLSNG